MLTFRNHSSYLNHKFDDNTGYSKLVLYWDRVLYTQARVVDLNNNSCFILHLPFVFKNNTLKLEVVYFWNKVCDLRSTIKQMIQILHNFEVFAKSLVIRTFYYISFTLLSSTYFSRNSGMTQWHFSVYINYSMCPKILFNNLI